MKKLILLTLISVMIGSCVETENYNKKGKFIWYVQQAILTGHDITVDSSNFTEGCYSVEYDGHVYGHPRNCRRCAAEKQERDRVENAEYSTIDTSKIKPIHPDHLKYIEAGYGHVYVRTSDGKMVHDPRCPNPFHEIESRGRRGSINKH